MLEIVYYPQALFRVRAVTRCTSSIPGNGIMVGCYSNGCHSNVVVVLYRSH